MRLGVEGWSRSKNMLPMLLFGLMLAAGCSEEKSFAALKLGMADAAAPAAASVNLPEAPAVSTAPTPAAAPAVQVRRASMADFEVRSILAPDGAMATGDFAWNADGVAEGPLRVVVDLAWQRIYVYRGGVEIGRSSIIYGADNKPTPTGIFPILQKKRHHISNLYGAPMPYMLRLTNDGIAIHASEVEDGTATHGCIGIPDEFAALLFGQAKPGDLVMITNGWLRDVYRGQA